MSIGETPTHSYVADHSPSRFSRSHKHPPRLYLSLPPPFFASSPLTDSPTLNTSPLVIPMLSSISPFSSVSLKSSIYPVIYHPSSPPTQILLHLSARRPSSSSISHPILTLPSFPPLTTPTLSRPSHPSYPYELSPPVEERSSLSLSISITHNTKSLSPSIFNIKIESTSVVKSLLIPCQSPPSLLSSSLFSLVTPNSHYSLRHFHLSLTSPLPHGTFQRLDQYHCRSSPLYPSISISPLPLSPSAPIRLLSQLTLRSLSSLHIISSIDPTIAVTLSPPPNHSISVLSSLSVITSQSPLAPFRYLLETRPLVSYLSHYLLSYRSLPSTQSYITSSLSQLSSPSPITSSPRAPPSTLASETPITLSTSVGPSPYPSNSLSSPNDISPVLSLLKSHLFSFFLAHYHLSYYFLSVDIQDSSSNSLYLLSSSSIVTLLITSPQILISSSILQLTQHYSSPQETLSHGCIIYDELSRSQTLIGTLGSDRYLNHIRSPPLLTGYHNVSLKENHPPWGGGGGIEFHVPHTAPLTYSSLSGKSPSHSTVLSFNSLSRFIIPIYSLSALHGFSGIFSSHFISSLSLFFRLTSPLVSPRHIYTPLPLQQLSNATNTESLARSSRSNHSPHPTLHIPYILSVLLAPPLLPLSLLTFSRLNYIQIPRSHSFLVLPFFSHPRPNTSLQIDSPHSPSSRQGWVLLPSLQSRHTQCISSPLSSSHNLLRPIDAHQDASSSTSTPSNDSTDPPLAALITPYAPLFILEVSHQRSPHPLSVSVPLSDPNHLLRPLIISLLLKPPLKVLIFDEGNPLLSTPPLSSVSSQLDFLITSSSHPSSLFISHLRVK
ncbi:unnamed protein product [Nezara viridula]|uniref:Uncharacterized protein n=1 Tax=Nezara viridula TaxID=85310 RepID=A0A9P0HUR3_NEZVI|nr:unnamed protein product [Nezara viridula]